MIKDASCINDGRPRIYAPLPLYVHRGPHAIFGEGRRGSNRLQRLALAVRKCACVHCSAALLVLNIETAPQCTSNTLNFKVFLGEHAPRPPLPGALGVQVHLSIPPIPFHLPTPLHGFYTRYIRLLPIALHFIDREVEPRNNACMRDL